ncbi:MAG: hypothetical protein MJZ84_08805 [Paludibacteraceae bacterium]|nr:hypothetical protein [Paludibacteraceae bacterium]
MVDITFFQGKKQTNIALFQEFGCKYTTKIWHEQIYFLFLGKKPHFRENGSCLLS